MSTLNLDQKAAQYAQKIIKVTIPKPDEAKAVENLITKTLGVLQEQGVYAMMLFLFSRTSNEKEIASQIREQLYALLGILPAFVEKKNDIPSKDTKTETVLQFFSDRVCENINILLMVKDLYEQTLIYARYGAKAEGK